MLFRVVCVVCISCVYGASVWTRVGQLDGSDYVTRSGKQVFTFLGIPYAQPPVGSRRFQPPEAVREWRSLRPAKDYGHDCAQFYTLVDVPEKIIGEEDCLYLNIFTPSLFKSSRLPVIVFFHAGGFMYGSSRDLKPDLLLNSFDFVFVTVNYRVGPFGFLSTEDDVVPGNNGLKDQVEALKWVKENIIYFGGDPNRVTITGSSAGAASVHFHYFSKLSRGLFHKGISLSGSALLPIALVEEPLLKAKRLAESVNCPTDSTVLLVQCLKKTPARDLLDKTETLFMPWRFNPVSPFGPVVEKPNYNSFLTDYPYYLLKTGQIYDVPWLVSVTTEEGLYPAASFIDREQWMESLRKDWFDIAPYLLDFNFTLPLSEHDEISEKIRTFYFKGKEISYDSREILVEMLSDRLFKGDIALAARLQALVASSPVYFYKYGYRGNISLTDIISEHKENYGVSHYDDVFYLVFQPGSDVLSVSDMKMSKALTSIWAGFVLEGDPSRYLGYRWQPICQDLARSGSISYVLVRRPREVEAKVHDDFGNQRFWRSLGLEENSGLRKPPLIKQYEVIINY